MNQKAAIKIHWAGKFIYHEGKEAVSQMIMHNGEVFFQGVQYPEMTPKDSKIHEIAAGVKVLFSFFFAISSKYREEYMYINALKCRRHGNFGIGFYAHKDVHSDTHDAVPAAPSKGLAYGLCFELLRSALQVPVEGRLSIG